MRIWGCWFPPTHKKGPGGNDPGPSLLAGPLPDSPRMRDAWGDCTGGAVGYLPNAATISAATSAAVTV
jgi:hypothetical protein